jgi:hypothetical protein
VNDIERRFTARVGSHDVRSDNDGVSWCFLSVHHASMETEDRKRFEVNGIEVSFVRDLQGARWECNVCTGQCEHVLRALAWLSVETWSRPQRDRLQ